MPEGIILRLSLPGIIFRRTLSEPFYPTPDFLGPDSLLTAGRSGPGGNSLFRNNQCRLNQHQKPIGYLSPVPVLRSVLAAGENQYPSIGQPGSKAMEHHPLLLVIQTSGSSGFPIKLHPGLRLVHMLSSRP